MERGIVLQKTGSGRPRTSDEDIERIRAAFGQSPDVTPLDFFLWSYVKDVIFCTQVQDLNDLKQRMSIHIHHLWRDTAMYKNKLIII
jgi:hypothetical protein